MGMGIAVDPLHQYEDGMRAAIRFAGIAVQLGERPFGAVIYDNAGELLGCGFGSESPTNPIAHSEIVAIQEACAAKGGYLQGCTLYSTHEPCPMCCGAINHAKLSTVVYGSARYDLPRLFKPRNVHVYDRLTDTSVPPTIVGGVLRKECVQLFKLEDLRV